MVLVFLPDPLCDPALLAALGLAGATRQPARLAGHALALSDDNSLPGLVADAESRCDGQVIAAAHGVQTGVSTVFSVAGCELADGAVAGQPALIPMARGCTTVDGAAWRARTLPIWVAAVPDILALADRLSIAEIVERLPMILSRSHSRTRAQAEPRPDRSGFLREDVVLDDQRQPYTEYFAVNEYIVRHPTFAGGITGPLRRAVFMAADAVTVLPYDPVRDRVLLVEQFRAAPYARGDRHPWLLEPIAGRIEPGDTPDETAHKEAREEAGLRLQALHRIASYYPSTGCFSEYLVSFIGIADLPDDAAGLHGLETEGEDIRTHLVSRTDLLARIAAGEMPDGPLLLSAYWLELNRARLLAG